MKKMLIYKFSNGIEPHTVEVVVTSSSQELTQDKDYIGGYAVFPANIYKPLLDFSLFKLWVFRSYFIGVCLSYFGYINPILFLPAYARDQGVDPFNAALLISIMAVADFFSRLISGCIGNMGWIRRSIILACSQAVAGAVLIIATLFPSYTSALVICLSHGAIGGALFSLFSVVLVDFIGPTKISAGVGLAYLGMGFTQTPMPSLLGN